MSADTASAGQLRAFIERVERIEEEVAGLNADKRDIFAEAKGQGFDVKALKAVLGIRRKDPSARQEHNALVALYLSTLGMADAAEEIENNTPSRVQVQAHPRVREADETRPLAGSHPEPAASGNTPGLGEGGIGNAPAQGYSAAAEAPMDSGSRTGERNEVIGRDEAGVSAEPIPTLGHTVSRTSDVGSLRDWADGTANAASVSDPASDAVARESVTAGERPGTRSPDYLLAEARLDARQAERLLDPAHPLFPILFKARHGRDPEGEELTTGVPALAGEAV